MHLVLSPRAELVRGALCSNFKQKFRGQTGRTRQDFGALSPNCTNTDACQGPQGRTHLMSLCPVLVCGLSSCLDLRNLRPCNGGSRRRHWKAQGDWGYYGWVG